MKKTSWVAVLCLLILAFTTCKKEKPASGANNSPAPVLPPPPVLLSDTSGGATPPPTTPPSAGLAPYSGTWTGIATIRDSFPASCQFTDKRLEIAQEWTVLADSVQVKETVNFDFQTWIYYWRGTIRNDTVVLISMRNVNCFNVMKLREMVVKGLITSGTDKYNMEGSALYSMCPPDCLFMFTYQLAKGK